MILVALPFLLLPNYQSAAQKYAVYVVEDRPDPARQWV